MRIQRAYSRWSVKVYQPVNLESVFEKSYGRSFGGITYGSNP